MFYDFYFDSITVTRCCLQSEKWRIKGRSPLKSNSFFFPWSSCTHRCLWFLHLHLWFCMEECSEPHLSPLPTALPRPPPRPPRARRSPAALCCCTSGSAVSAADMISAADIAPLLWRKQAEGRGQKTTTTEPAAILGRRNRAQRDICNLTFPG